MQTKNVNPIEAHFEKAILGVAVLFLAAICVIYVATPFSYPVTIKGVKPGEAVTLKLLNSNLDKAAKTVDRQLATGAAPTVEELEVPNYAARVESLLNRPYITEGSTPAPVWGNLGVVRPLASTKDPDPDTLYVPRLAPITDITVKLGYSGFINPADAQLLKIAPPYDTQWAMIEAPLDLQAILTEFKRNPGGQIRPIPTEWYLSTLAITDVILERQHQKADGTWSEVQVVGPLPGAQDLLIRLRQLDMDSITLEQSKEIRKLITAEYASIYQAKFPELKNVEIPSLEKKEEVDPAAVQPAVQPAGQPGAEAPTIKAPAPFDQDSIVIRAFDWGLKAKTTYRYRLRFEMTNPLYGQKDLPSDQAELNATKFSIENLSIAQWNQFTEEKLPEDSDWSTPVTTMQTTDFYLTSYNSNNGKATFSIWKFHNGAWRKATFDVSDGDAIGWKTGQYEPAEAGGNDIINFFTGYYVVDVDSQHTIRQPGAAKLQVTRVIMVKDNKLFERFDLLDQTKAQAFEQKQAEMQALWNPIPEIINVPQPGDGEGEGDGEGTTDTEELDEADIDKGTTDPYADQ